MLAGQGMLPGVLLFTACRQQGLHFLMPVIKRASSPARGEIIFAGDDLVDVTLSHWKAFMSD